MTLLAAHPLLLAAIGGGGIALCILLAFGDSGRSRLSRRVERLTQRGRVAPQAALSLRRAADGGLDTLARHLLPRPDRLRERLTRTGRSIGLGAYAIACATIAILGGLLALFLGLSLVTAALLGILAGLWLPHLVVGRLIAKRLKKFEALFPEAIGLIVRGLRSGLPASESMQIVGREIADPVGEEFRKMSDQIKLGQSLEQALWDAAKRIGMTEFNFLVVTMIVQRETGGNLAETLENLDTVLRRRRQMRLKIKAMSSEARASATIIGSLPFIMFTILFVVNRAYVMTLVTTHAGHMLLGVAAASLATGIAVIMKLIRFEI